MLPVTPGRSSEPVSPQTTAAAEEMPHECTTTQCSQTPAGATPDVTPDLPNRNTESNSEANANTGAANGKGNGTVDNASPTIEPPFKLRQKHGLATLLGKLDGKPYQSIVSIRYCHTCQHEKLMDQILVLARAGCFKTKSDAERERDELCRCRRFAAETALTLVKARYD